MARSSSGRVQLLLHLTALLGNHYLSKSLSFPRIAITMAKTVRSRRLRGFCTVFLFTIIYAYSRLFGKLAAAFDRFGKRSQQLFGTFPRHAGVGDGFAVLELVERSGLLIAGFQEAFHHDAADALFACCDAGGDVFDHFSFAHFVLAAVAVRRVDDKTVFARAGRLGNLQIGQRLRHGFGIVVRAVRGAAQHQVAIGIALVSAEITRPSRLMDRK